MQDSDDEELRELVAAGADGRQRLSEIFERHRPRLRRIVEMRMDPRLGARLDASDVLQETFLEASARLADYLADPRMPLPLWLRYLAGQQLINHHRHHVSAQKRDAGRQVSIDRAGGVGMTSVALADLLLTAGTSPTGAAVRSEVRARLVATIEGMAPLDREVLVLRHYEQLSNEEVAQLLDIPKTTASSRYVRALKHLQELLADSGLLGQ